MTNHRASARAEDTISRVPSKLAIAALVLLAGGPIGLPAGSPAWAEEPPTAAASIAGEEPPVYFEDLGGPRLGATFGRDGWSTTQFGWHAEHQVSPGRHGPWLVVETVLLVGGLDHSAFVPSGSLIFGARTPGGFEFGIGPSLTLGGQKMAQSGVVLAAGYSFRLGAIRIPLNVAYVPSRTGDDRVSVITGWAIRSQAR